MTASVQYPDLTEKSVFITGGGSGIGLSLTRGFAAQGAKVAYVDLIETPGTDALYLHGDVTDVTSLQTAMDAAAQAHGPIDILINNAANDMRFDSLDVTEAEWDAQQSVNLKHMFFACQHAARTMIERGQGVIVNLSSIAYLIPIGGMTPYVTAKTAIVGMTRALSRDWGPHGVRINAIAPGMVLTERQLRDWITPEIKAQGIARQALDIEIGPDDIVGPALFLASDASSVITGQCLPVDGGVAVTG